MSEEQSAIIARLAVIETLVKGIAEKDTDHEARIRRLEKWIFIATGAAAAAGSAVGSYVGKLPSL